MKERRRRGGTRRRPCSGWLGPPPSGRRRPNDAHRAKPGHEGIPVHTRDVALARARLQRTAVFFLSPYPSLKLYAPEVRRREHVRELPPSRPGRWPAVRIVDMRGSGAALSSTLLEACSRSAERRESTGVVVGRLGYATAVSCTLCGTIKRCPNCVVPLILHGRKGPLVCTHCGHREQMGPCARCGRPLRPAGLGVAGARRPL